MHGVVIWVCDTSMRAIVWCADSGELAFSRGPEALQDATCRLETGDLVRFDLARADGGRSDLVRFDAARAKKGRADAGQVDASQIDMGQVHRGQADAGQSDAGRSDADSTGPGRADAGRVDAGHSQTPRLCRNLTLVERGYRPGLVDSLRRAAEDISRPPLRLRCVAG